ncbi:MAG TPA: GPW/gp25 family protein [Flavipsychrobacter sp.]|nr:GPW/gp25 family protein [Flavipsychrobacter sp.]
MPEYLKLPLNFNQFFEQDKLNTCSIKDSIARNLHLLITTNTGENKQNLQYGAQFWDHDYDIHMSNDKRREQIIQNLKAQISLFEKRLADVVVEVNIKQTEYNTQANRQLRRKIEIIITGLIVRSKEPYRFQTGFFIGPLSFD